jgi:cobalt-zinc-cadmium efflux system outer membrane protein
MFINSPLPLWLLCATVLTSHSAFAVESKSQTHPAPTLKIAENSSTLTLQKAMTKALAQSPRLQAFKSRLAMAKGEQQQAGAWSNPEVGIEAENIGGKGTYKGIDSAELTYGISQEIQMGGKISARETIAGVGLEIASLAQQAAALDVMQEVTIAYTQAVAAEENVRLATEQKALAQDVLESVRIRVGAAAAPLIQQSRAEVELSSASIALDTARREREIASQKLATVLGEEKAEWILESADFYAVTALEVLDADAKLKANPDLAALHAQLAQSKGKLELERATAIPDPRVNLGVRDFRSSNEQAFVLGVSLPIPVFNANGGNIQKARSEIQKTEQENEYAALSLRAELINAQQQGENAYLRVQTLRKEVLPSAEKAFGLARTGYGLGRFPYLEVLDAQRSLFGVKQQHIAALTDFHTAKAQIDRLTAARLSQLQKSGENHE